MAAWPKLLLQMVWNMRAGGAKSDQGLLAWGSGWWRSRMVKYSPMFPKQVPLCRPHCKPTSSFPHRAQATLAPLQPPSVLQFTMLTFGRLYLDCKVIGDHRCTPSVAVVLAMLAKTSELFLSLRECLTLTSTPCNGSAIRRSPGLPGSDLQILLLLSSGKQPWEKAVSWQVSHPKTYPSLAPDTHEPHSQAAESSAAGTFR